MSDTIVVTAPNPSIDPPSYGGGLFDSTAPNHSPSAGQIFLQVTLPFYQSANFCISSLAWLEKYIADHGATNPLTLQVVANNIRYFCNADTNLVHNPRISVYDAYHSMNPAPAKYDYHSMSIPEMSGNVTTPIAAFGHYLWGNGQERKVNLTDIGLKITPSQISPVMNIVNSGVVGTFPISTNFTRDTSIDGVIPAAYLGNITLKTEGSLVIDAGGSWHYNGVIHAYNDVFDFNPSTHRGVIAESLTRLGRLFTGSSYPISMPGQINISGSGQR